MNLINTVTVMALVKLASCKHEERHTQRIADVRYCSRCGAVRMGEPLGWVRPVLLERIADLLESAKAAEEQVCQVHDANDPVPWRVCGAAMPCKEHSNDWGRE